MSIDKAQLSWAALLLALIAAVWTAWSVYPAALYRHHGFSPAGLDTVRPTGDVRPVSFVAQNYLWGVSRVFPHTEATIHLNRIVWMLLAGAAFALFVRGVSNDRAAPFLSFIMFLTIPTIASSRLWSPGAHFNMAATLGCLCLCCEWRNIAGRAGPWARILGVILYSASVLTAEYFYSIPILLLVMFVTYHTRNPAVLTLTVAYAGRTMIRYVPAVVVLTYLIYVSRKHFLEAGLGLVGDILSMRYAKSVIGQVTSNVGDRFFLFLIDNVYRYYERLSGVTIVGLLLFAGAVAVVFVRLVAHGARDAVVTQRHGAVRLVGIGVALVLLSALANSVAFYTYSLGYGEDRTNTASALGATMVLTGVATMLVAARGRLRVVGVVATTVVLFSMLKASALQAHDWRQVRRWEVELQRDVREYLEHHRAGSTEEHVVVHGLPRFVSSFEFDGELIWLAYAYPRLEGPPGPYYRVPVEEIERKRHSWREKVKRHFSRGYRFWPLLMSPVHPTAETLMVPGAVRLVHVDKEFGIGCTPRGIVLPVNGGQEVVPTEVEGGVFGEWREGRRTVFERFGAEDCALLAARVNGGHASKP